MKKTILAALLVAACSTVIAADWTQIEETPKFAAFVELSSISKNGDYALMWTGKEYKERQYYGNKSYFSTASKEEYNCPIKQMRQLSLVAYSKTYRSGQVVADIKFNPRTEVGDWVDIVPGSIGDSYLTIACRKK